MSIQHSHGTSLAFKATTEEPTKLLLSTFTSGEKYLGMEPTEKNMGHEMCMSVMYGMDACMSIYIYICVYVCLYIDICIYIYYIVYRYIYHKYIHTYIHISRYNMHVYVYL